ncbi:MAG: DNA mismatch endonuclease Vsr [Bacteroidota bacterium]|nr:DNA mismatch endonuclease Vsr [Bacteroidota bacterium]
MADIFTKKKRSAIMQKIGPQNSSQEKKLQSLLTSLGYKYNLHSKKLPGKPDIVFPRRKKVIFVNGCFWHGHTCGRATLPRTNRAFWKNKIEGNIKRDKRVRRELSKLGWKSLVVWQCQLKKSKREVLTRRIEKFIHVNVS